jgi:hypothetical protein
MARRIAPKKIFEDVYVPMDTVRPDDVVTLIPLKNSVMSVNSTKTLRRHPALNKVLQACEFPVEVDGRMACSGRLYRVYNR